MSRMLACLASLLAAARAYQLGGFAGAPARAPRAAVARSEPMRMIATDFRASESPVGTLPDCPKTIWNADDLDVEFWQKKYKEETPVACPVEVVATPEANAAGKAWFIERKDELTELLAKHGTIWFRDLDLMKDPAGFREFWEALGQDPCLDPIHTSGLRKFLSKDDAVYEEVNKQSLSRHYIGLHNESTYKKTATNGAFVCFAPATVDGGEFFIADGEGIFRDLDPEVLKELYERQATSHQPSPPPPPRAPLSPGGARASAPMRARANAGGGLSRRCASRCPTSTSTCSACSPRT